MIDRIRAVFYKNALGKLLSSQNRQRKTHTLNSAQNIGILFDASEKTTRAELSEWVKKLEKEGKKTKMLGFFNVKQLTESHPFDFFTLKESTWQGLPNSQKALQFSQEKFDLLLSFNPEELSQLEWIAAGSPAAMKIGLATTHKNDFDIQLDTPDGKGFSFFIEQLNFYLDKIVLTKS